MKIIEQSTEILNNPDFEQMLRNIEYAGRVCYQSHDKATPNSYSDFVKRLVKRGHLSVLEHEQISVRVITSRANVDRLTRHRKFAFSVESTRFNKYNQLDFCTDIDTADLNDVLYKIETEFDYLMREGKTRIAKMILPMCLKTEMIMTGNLRAWFEMFPKRISQGNDPTMIELMKPLYNEFCEVLPEIFGEIE